MEAESERKHLKVKIGGAWVAQVGWVSAFGLSPDLKVLGSSLMLGSLISVEGIDVSLTPSVLSLTNQSINQSF